MPPDSLTQSLRHAIGTAARESRLRQGLTQEDVAARLDMATEVYGRLERGTVSPSIFTLRKLCVTLNLSADRMLGTVHPAVALPRVRAPVLQSPEARHLGRMLERARKLSPRSLRVLLQLATLLPQKAPGRTPSRRS
ncbi:helix-turn-helix domain-containing protein [Melittangium boletus]|uniref:Transcriptional regulator n=1 Tax=Melittangium boletus DSM 14713 TaxID=1294270 RepID=A0A250ID63_9BACT|nr:helix-turn-helix transcriptional regulator [Melittangium boletus]ATB29158.1 transcriptional regulator [Melittangium boletus DSM 14713]